MLEVILLVASLLPFYALGAVPSAYIVARRYGVDILGSGSGNPGAANVARVIGKRAGAATLVIDAMKGFVGALVAWLLTRDFQYLSYASVALVAGACFSVPGKLRGGKGVAISLGVFLFIAPVAATIGVITFALIFYLSRITSISSVSSAIIAAISGLYLRLPDPIQHALFIIGLIIVLRHRENLKRFMEGDEKKFSFASEVEKKN